MLSRITWASLLLTIGCDANIDAYLTPQRIGNTTIIAHIQSTPPYDLPEYLEAVQQAYKIKPITIQFDPGYMMIDIPHVACSWDGYVIRVRTIEEQPSITMDTSLPHEMAHHILQSNAHNDAHAQLTNGLRFKPVVR